MNQQMHWYNNAIIYALDIGSFKDGNGDGIGDFRGATEKLDYFVELGVNCIWLLPFYESEEKDNGYDVDNYYNINRKFGNFDDFLKFKQEAEKRNIRLVIDLVVHHTSNNHPWFKLAGHNKDSKYYHYYKWNKTPPLIPEDNVFKGQENNTWEYCEVNDEYYFHKFYSFEPDLKLTNPEVQHEIKEILRFWLGFGVSGFRLDAATHMFEEFDHSEGKSSGEIMEELNEFLVSIKEDAFFLAEADVESSQLENYIGEGNRMRMLFNFVLNNKIFLSLARQEPEPMIQQLNNLPEVPKNVLWANFIRTLDELDLGRLTDEEKEEVYASFAQRDIMKAFDRGIRRRIAPMISGNIDRHKMIQCLLFSLPGVPVVVYGDEIGMGDNLVYKGRNAVRTPMQWNSSKNGGFSDAHPDELERKSISEGIFSYKFVNVEEQKIKADSLLNEMKRLIDVRKHLSRMFLKDFSIMNTNVKEVFGLKYTDDLLIYINFSAERKEIISDINFEEYEDLLNMDSYKLLDQQNKLPLRSYGYRWLRKKP